MDLFFQKNRDFRERILSSLSSNEVYLARREDPDATELINQLETTDTIIGVKKKQKNPNLKSPENYLMYYY